MSWQKLQVAPHDLARIAGYGSTAWQSGDGLRAVTYALILLLIGGGVEWLYWCYAGRARRAIAEAAMAGSDHAVPAPRGAVALSARRAVLEARGCVLFAVSIVAASLAFTWPTGLQETVVGIALLVAATRLTAIAVRVLLAPDCPRLRLRCDGVAGSAYRRRLGRNCGRRIVIAQSMRWALSGARTRLHCEPRCRAGDLRVRAGRNPVVVCRAQHHRAPPGRARCVDRAAISSDCRGGRRRWVHTARRVPVRGEHRDRICRRRRGAHNTDAYRHLYGRAGTGNASRGCGSTRRLSACAAANGTADRDRLRPRCARRRVGRLGAGFVAVERRRPAARRWARGHHRGAAGRSGLVIGEDGYRPPRPCPRCQSAGSLLRRTLGSRNPAGDLGSAVTQGCTHRDRRCCGLSLSILARHRHCAATGRRRGRWRRDWIRHADHSARYRLRHFLFAGGRLPGR